MKKFQLTRHPARKITIDRLGADVFTARGYEGRVHFAAQRLPVTFQDGPEFTARHQSHGFERTGNTVLPKEATLETVLFRP